MTPTWTDEPTDAVQVDAVHVDAGHGQPTDAAFEPDVASRRGRLGGAG